ncbi:hypothetical protein NX722_08790 [Endozoicomonas gorgoniicola]|uniref:Metallo-beta-lactamase domain-containing protein n=1 Tax=Endozoicomonas gorgoniicola TaxID=1234144 RepID=A0ABT3MTM1_9GAMM|nr:hypothetical protein [Endozoicomonas gorgoniicola]MCW7552735.1 hypothetical protein [Endozoicomonas gorgoniicola]
MTGDHHYEKIYDAIKTRYTGKDIILVTPHHGGYAGNLTIGNWLSEFNVIECPISVGTNTYRHPSQNIENLKKLQKSKPQITQDIGDITFKI